MSEIEETAKATQEVAKTTNTAIETTRDFGNYMSQFFTPPLEQVSELITDKLKYYTWSNKVNLMSKAKEKIDKLGLHTQNNIPLKLGIPLLEAASLEEDDKLQELWANLLVNSSTEFSLERSYISVLEQLSSFEAEILIEIYSKIDYDGMDSYRIEINNYPTINVIKNEDSRLTVDEAEKYYDDIIVGKGVIEKRHQPIDSATKSMDDKLKLALSNLFRLQCIEKLITFDNAEIFSSVSPTLFGAKLYEAVKEPTK